MNRQTGERLESEIEHIKQSISDILLTPKGSRIMRRDYGSHLLKLIDRPLSAGLALQISAACVMALKQWEPRIEVKAFKVSIQRLAHAHQVTGSLEAIVKKSQTKLTLSNLNLSYE
ncbi:hypothetical protein RO21_10235 [[Actinobacillus] muris]|uniref:IraD/Gp25-like domain-containing protein n=1 Tax=Muribacter muris TaxID=67855 RepID=A0A0J5P395_9PAST|nr:GPW/gp25 family protein [Muribacter muris]KMK50716.1 hypothetical protein RO21_10235 [[Actinobacillus] muris] [Muribacter muris]